jgi:hypothetical protein
VINKLSNTKWYSFYKEIENAADYKLNDVVKNECSICLDSIHCMDEYKTTCDHYFHKKCIRDTFILHRCDKCPNCMDTLVIFINKIPKKTIKKYRKLLIPLIQNNKEEYIEFFEKHYINRFDDLLV